MKKRNLLGKVHHYNHDGALYMGLFDTPPGFIVSDDVGTYWYAFDMMDLLSPATHALALELKTVGFEYGE